ncbi:zinc finger protein 467-like [Eublepharis macularius]|uniref:Zinc finger protein 467-like n=1 Tax=Eublepharis macularius TaxID=481883 RepID=A0AA97K0Q8_EUBMA|nr:zinc finger protein 467-like [Eublepharis macularius]
MARACQSRPPSTGLPAGRYRGSTQGASRAGSGQLGTSPESARADAPGKKPAGQAGQPPPQHRTCGNGKGMPRSQAGGSTAAPGGGHSGGGEAAGEGADGPGNTPGCNTLRLAPVLASRLPPERLRTRRRPWPGPVLGQEPARLAPHRRGDGRRPGTQAGLQSERLAALAREPRCPAWASQQPCAAGRWALPTGASALQKLKGAERAARDGPAGKSRRPRLVAQRRPPRPNSCTRRPPPPAAQGLLGNVVPARPSVPGGSSQHRPGGAPGSLSAAPPPSARKARPPERLQEGPGGAGEGADPAGSGAAPRPCLPAPPARGPGLPGAGGGAPARSGSGPRMAVGAAAQVPVRCEDRALQFASERWKDRAAPEDAMRENFGSTIALGSPTAQPGIEEGGLPPVKAQRGAETSDAPGGSHAGMRDKTSCWERGIVPPETEGTVRSEQQPGDPQRGPGDPKGPERSCPGEWLIRTVKVETEDYSEWPAGLSAEVLLSGLPVGAVCKSEGLSPGGEEGASGGLGELSGLALQQWQMLSEEKSLGCPRCEHPGAPLEGSQGDPRPRPFACSQCGKAFGKKAHLTRHARVHTGERPFACTHCGRRFSQKIHLGSHERVHTGERPFPCGRCPKSFRKKTHLVRHQLTHTGERPHACPLCSRSFVHRRHLLRHQRLHEEGNAACREHVEPRQGPEPCSRDLEPGKDPEPCREQVGHQQPVAPPVESGQATALCRDQSELGQTATPYREEAGPAQGLTSCTGPPEPYLGPVLFKAQAEQEPGRVPCLDYPRQGEALAPGMVCPEQGPCGMTCGVQAEAEGSTLHVERISKTEPEEEEAGSCQLPEEKPFLCSDCGKAFAWRKNLASHQRLHAEGGRPFSCAECGRGFSDKRHLTAHLRGHMGLLPYACPHCERSFAHRAGLAAHQCGGHAGQRPFACSECGRCFAHKRHLQRHRRNQHSAERPFSCAQCGRTFSTRASLLAHVKSHAGQRPFACPLCGRAFSRKSHLARHEAVHTGLRPHACSQCPRRFSSKTNLVRHQAVHTGLRPYICTHCARSFSRKTHLLRHERTHISTPMPSAPSWPPTLPQSALPHLQSEQPMIFPVAFESAWQ